MRAATATLLAVACLALVACGDDRGDEPAASDDAAEPTGREPAQPDAAPPEEEPPVGEEGAQAGEGAGAGAGARQTIQAAIDDAIASGDPRLACGAAVTDAYLRDTYGGAAGCRGAQAPELAAETVSIGRIVIEGDRARTTVVAEGGAYTGERLRARLVLEGTEWRLDRLASTAPPGP